MVIQRREKWHQKLLENFSTKNFEQYKKFVSTEVANAGPII